MPINRVVQELWRAAQSQPDADWGTFLAAPVIGRCLDLAAESSSATEALSLVTREIIRSRSSSLATDIAKRAIVQSFLAADRIRGFTESLFGEATSYLVSRDLAGYVGSMGRNKTVADAIVFKEAVRAQVVQVVREGVPPSVGGGEEAWRQFVTLTIERLARRLA